MSDGVTKVRNNEITVLNIEFEFLTDLTNDSKGEEYLSFTHEILDRDYRSRHDEHDDPPDADPDGGGEGLCLGGGQLGAQRPAYGSNS